MSEWISCPKCGALMIGITAGHICPLCGYRLPVQTITTTTGTSAEYVPVIRCKDCKYGERWEPDKCYCNGFLNAWVDEDDFCAWAEPKDTTEEVRKQLKDMEQRREMDRKK